MPRVEASEEGGKVRIPLLSLSQSSQKALPYTKMYMNLISSDILLHPCLVPVVKIVKYRKTFLSPFCPVSCHCQGHGLFATIFLAFLSLSTAVRPSCDSCENVAVLSKVTKKLDTCRLKLLQINVLFPTPHHINPGMALKLETLGRTNIQP